MVIDTEKLKKAIQTRDDNSEINWDTCPMSLLNRLESRAIKSLRLVDDIENLFTQLKKEGIY